MGHTKYILSCKTYLSTLLEVSLGLVGEVVGDDPLHPKYRVDFWRKKVIY